MNDLEQLSDRLHELADAPASAAPTHHLLERGRRARRRRAALASTSLAVLAIAGVTAVAVANHANGPIDWPSASASAQNPQAELVAAIAGSENISFRLKTTTTFQKGDGKVTVPANTYAMESAFDPATSTGYARSAKGDFEIRLIEGVRYMKNGSFQWVQYKGTYQTLGFDDGQLRDKVGVTADSQQLFRTLGDGGGTVVKTGSRIYHFEVIGTEDGGTTKFFGDVTLDGKKRIAKVTYDWTLTYSQGGFQSSKVVLEYSGYGDPVSVERPAAVHLWD
jgi:hypothetical protein